VIVFVVWHIHHAPYLDGSPAQHRDEDGRFAWDEEDGDDPKILGIFSSQERAAARIELARGEPGFRDEPDCFLVDEHTLDEDLWTGGFVTERREAE